MKDLDPLDIAIGILLVGWLSVVIVIIVGKAQDKREAAEPARLRDVCTTKCFCDAGTR